mmetsp:Transcript_69319/g.130770  ORF Transcript_69319/g.130770 Transcript_69319/m.130770 type:complete len:148 (+) Transcript_69319:78-521(+)
MIKQCCCRKADDLSHAVEAEMSYGKVKMEPCLSEMVEHEEKTLDQEEHWIQEALDQVCPNPEARKSSNPSKGCILFDDNGEEIQIKFFQHPLGIAFSPDVPLIVEQVAGNAKLLGVKPGWQVKAIAGLPVAQKDFQTLVNELLALEL